MTKKSTAVWAITTFVVGMVIGGLGGALVVTYNMIRIDTQAIVYSIADHTAALTPLVTYLNEDELDQFASSARQQLTTGVVIIHHNLDLVSAEKRDMVEGVLASIARSRERLRLGQYADPPRPDVEEILDMYSE